MKLTRQQVKQIRAILKQNKEVTEVEISESSRSGIGTNVYVRYTTSDGDLVHVDITEYDLW